MKIGITGATGFVGRALVKKLANAGHNLGMKFGGAARLHATIQQLVNVAQVSDS